MKFKVFILLVGLGLLLNSCSKKCKGDNENLEGILYSLPSSCVSSTVNVVIRSTTNYGVNKEDSVAFIPCRPDVNFAKVTVLGKYVSGHCNMRIERKVTRNTATKTVLYELTRYDCGACNELKYDYNVVVVDKIPDDWEVQFNVIQK